MKKSLVFLAVATVAASAAQAQSSVQLNGTIDMYVGSIKMAGDTERSNITASGGMTTSWLGVKGSEDLGGGLRANFNLSSYLRADSGATGRWDGDPMYSREANVGLSGSFGSLVFGRAVAPNFIPDVLFSPFGDSFTFSPLNLHAVVPLYNATGWTGTVPADTGWDNQIWYSTPNFGGLNVNLHYQLGRFANGSASSSGKHNIGFNALYYAGPLSLTAFYERTQIANPIPAVFVPADTKTVWMLGGSYDMTAVKLYLTYGQAKSDLTVKRTTTTIGASAPLGAMGKLLASSAHTKIDGGSSRTTTVIGYDYTLSQRTDLYAVLMNDRITSFDSGTSYGFGVRHRF